MLRKIMCRSRFFSRRGRRRLVLLAILSLCLAYYMVQTLTMPVRFLFINRNVNGQCIIPDLDPFDASIMKYVWSPEPIKCDPTPDLVYVNEFGMLNYNISAIKLYGSQSYSCTYAILERKPSDDYSVAFQKEVKVDLPVQVPADFFKVVCRDSSGTIVYDKLQESVYNKNVLARKSVAAEGNPKYSVFMFGLDSTSRLAAIRKLKKTYEYLTKDLDALVFEGYMKVGDNTFPNLVPVLTGKRPFTNDLPIKSGNYKQTTIDWFPFVWKRFSEEKYVTLYAEDYPDIASFDTEAGGFKEPPTDHYMRTWMLGMKKVGFASAVLKSVLLPFEYNNINLKQTSSLCFGNKPVHKHLIDYFKRFAAMYKGKLRFGFSWLTQICHEFVNYLELGDTDFYEFFKFLKEEGHLENAFLIFFSDHGSRIDDIRNTFVGRIEERMPLLTIIPPDSFKSKSKQLYKNMQENTKRLASNFDLHKTLTDIVSGNFESTLKFSNSAESRGISLFQPIPEDRSCADASIPEHFCACYGSKPVPVTEPLVQEAAQFAVSHLNILLDKYQNICAKLILSKIHEAQIVSLGLSAQGEEENRWTIYKFISTPEKEKHKRFLIMFETEPSLARFEATVDYHVDSGLEVLDDISRTNKYGNTSVCVPEKPLRRYCYCKTNLLSAV